LVQVRTYADDGHRNRGRPRNDGYTVYNETMVALYAFFLLIYKNSLVVNDSDS